MTIQAQILDLLRRLRDSETGTAVLSHHPRSGAWVVRTPPTGPWLSCTAASIVEDGRTVRTYVPTIRCIPTRQGLLKSIPRLEDDDAKRLYMIKGTVPNPLEMPPGCHFSDRCDSCMDIRRTKVPDLVDVDGREVRCFLYEDADGQAKDASAIAQAEAEAQADAEAARDVEAASALLEAEELREAELTETDGTEEANR